MHIVRWRKFRKDLEIIPFLPKKQLLNIKIVGKSKNFLFAQFKDVAESGDSGRNSETIETLQERSDEAAQCEPSGKRPPETQSKSEYFSNHFFSFHVLSY